MVSLADWRSLGAPLLKPAQVRLRSATGDDMGVSGTFVVRGWCDKKKCGVDIFGLASHERSFRQSGPRKCTRLLQVFICVWASCTSQATNSVRALLGRAHEFVVQGRTVDRSMERGREVPTRVNLKLYGGAGSFIPCVRCDVALFGRAASP